MELEAIFVGGAMLIVSIPFVAKPFQEKRFKKKRNIDVRLDPQEDRQAVLSALRDLDFDFRTGKVSEDDYTALRAQLLTKAATYIQSEEKISDEQIEAMIAARKAAGSNFLTCSNCGCTVEADNLFCSQCGTIVAENCPSCGKPVKEGDYFCTSCGTKLDHKVETIA